MFYLPIYTITHSYGLFIDIWTEAATALKEGYNGCDVSTKDPAASHRREGPTGQHYVHGRVQGLQRP